MKKEHRNCPCQVLTCTEIELNKDYIQANCQTGCPCDQYNCDDNPTTTTNMQTTTATTTVTTKMTTPSANEMVLVLAKDGSNWIPVWKQPMLINNKGLNKLQDPS